MPPIDIAPVLHGVRCDLQAVQARLLRVMGAKVAIGPATDKAPESAPKGHNSTVLEMAISRKTKELVGKKRGRKKALPAEAPTDPLPPLPPGLPTLREYLATTNSFRLRNLAALKPPA